MNTFMVTRFVDLTQEKAERFLNGFQQGLSIGLRIGRK